MNKPRQSFWQIFNMSFGFLGIQFGFGLQLANMSAIYEVLGATPDKLPLLWLAAPLSGLIIQPLIGNASDRTWTRLGRRRPYFLVGAILSSLMLLLMPSSSTLWMAATALWADRSTNRCIDIADASQNSINLRCSEVSIKPVSLVPVALDAGCGLKIACCACTRLVNSWPFLELQEHVHSLLPTA